MLVISRKVGETVTIGTDIEITITGFDGNRVRVGITAPRNVSINRGEVHARILKEQAAADAKGNGESATAVALDTG